MYTCRIAYMLFLRSVPASSDCIATVGHVAIINTMLLIVFDTKVRY